MHVSVGQALLLEIEKESKLLLAANAFASPTQKQELEQLKLYYLQGLPTQKGALKIKLRPYKAQWGNPIVINEDPTRRYFETHFAYETLKYNLCKLNLEQLTHYYEEIYSLFCQLFNAEFQNWYNDLLKASCSTDEFTFILSAVNTVPQYIELCNANALNKEKILCLTKIVFLIQCTMRYNNEKFPLNIYGTGVYAPKLRGKYSKYEDYEKERVDSNNLGVLKNYMPLPMNDIAFILTKFNFVKSVDTHNYDIKSEWVKYQFSSEIHPFSNSISGVILMQIRMFLHMQKTKNILPFHNKESFELYFRCLMSLLLFSRGGHTLFEFVAPLTTHPEIYKAFSPIFPGIKDVSFYSLFYKNNNTALDIALSRTTKYNKIILQRARMRQELQQRIPLAN